MTPNKFYKATLSEMYEIWWYLGRDAIFMEGNTAQKYTGQKVSFSPNPHWNWAEYESDELKAKFL